MRVRDETRRIEGTLIACAGLVILAALLLVYRAKMAGAPTNAVNLNTADAAKLTAALGVPTEIGERIVEYREQRGSFDNCEQIL